jgi:sec-independent protein translocase protein TatB
MELSFMEMVIIAVIAFVVLGPKELARHAHTLGKILGRIRREVENFKALTQEELLKEVRTQELERALNRVELEKQLNSRIELLPKTSNDKSTQAMESHSTDEPLLGVHNDGANLLPGEDGSVEDRAEAKNGSRSDSHDGGEGGRSS